MILKDLVFLNSYDDDKVLLVSSFTKDVILASSMMSDDLKIYYDYEVVYVGVSNDLGTNLLVFVKEYGEE